ncbi:MAG: hemerythrin domain-containing protein [Brevundimonas sp.]
MSDNHPLATRPGLPGDMLFLRTDYPRDRWAEPSLNDIAKHWLQMHAGFRRHQAYMDELVGQWRADRQDAPNLHRRLIPAVQQFLQHLDAHHNIESGHYFPAMRRVEPRISHGIDLLDRDHDAIHTRLEALFRDASAFHQAVIGGGEVKDATNRLGDTITAGAPDLLRHLEDEEDIVIPLIALRGDPLA